MANQEVQKQVTFRRLNCRHDDLGWMYFCDMAQESGHGYDHLYIKVANGEFLMMCKQCGLVVDEIAEKMKSKFQMLTWESYFQYGQYNGLIYFMEPIFKQEYLGMIKKNWTLFVPNLSSVQFWPLLFEPYIPIKDLVFLVLEFLNLDLSKEIWESKYEENCDGERYEDYVVRLYSREKQSSVDKKF